MAFETRLGIFVFCKISAKNSYFKGRGDKVKKTLYLCCRECEAICRGVTFLALRKVRTGQGALLRKAQMGEILYIP